MNSQQKDNLNRRRDPRVAVRFKATYRIVQPENGKERLKFQTHNLGSGGLMFYSDHPIEVETHLEVSLFLDEEPIELIAEVIWMKKEPRTGQIDPGYAIGLRFEIVTDGNFAKIDQCAQQFN
ncbi:MAG: PilZ domain-containing protein [Nitrospirae bacterium]|nr:PilZ domain-containing protein [Nitrospirota bacterium]MBI3352061.1 PilZ domain-containing protein [Nitrospirota bacterium]